MAETTFNEDHFNLEVRRFLKKVGITSQREIERAVREGIKTGALKGNEKLHAEVTLTVTGVKLSYHIGDDIALG